MEGVAMELENRNKAGLIARVFVKDATKLMGVVCQIEELVDSALRLTQADGRVLYSHIALLVTADARFPDHDAAGTDVALRAMLESHKDDPRYARVFVETITHGDPFCFALNRGMRLLLQRGVTHATVISFGVRKYLTQEFVDKTFALFNAGATVVGAVLPELRQSIERGCVANTLMTWEMDSLADVGFFSFAGRQHQLGGATRTIQSVLSKDISYPLQGVEEIVPLVWQAMARSEGKTITPFIGIVYPEGHEQWDVIDKDRETRKMDTKGIRQLQQALEAGADLSILEAAVLPQCRVVV